MRRAIIALAVVLSIFAAGSVSAADPDGRCKACATPRPVPSVIGLPTPTPVVTPPALLPDTSTEG